MSTKSITHIFTLAKSLMRNIGAWELFMIEKIHVFFKRDFIKWVKLMGTG
jgi:hypothetical protein